MCLFSAPPGGEAWELADMVETGRGCGGPRWGKQPWEIVREHAELLSQTPHPALLLLADHVEDMSRSWHELHTVVIT